MYFLLLFHIFLKLRIKLRTWVVSAASLGEGKCVFALFSPRFWTVLLSAAFCLRLFEATAERSRSHVSFIRPDGWEEKWLVCCHKGVRWMLAGKRKSMRRAYPKLLCEESLLRAKDSVCLKVDDGEIWWLYERRAS